MERPFYRAIANEIEARIATGNYPLGASLPPESTLEREFNVSRITIRQALGLLKRRGILYSRSGAGTLVRSPAPDANSMRMTGSLTDLTYYAAETTYRALDRRSVVPPDSIAKSLGFKSGERALCFRGVRSRRGVPNFGFEEIYIPEPLGLALDNRRLGGRTLFGLLEEANGLSIVEARQVITAVSAPAAISRHLGIPRRSPMLQVVRTYMVAGDRAVEVAVNHFVVSKFEYIMTLYTE